jgi:hypothetical protein
MAGKNNPGGGREATREGREHGGSARDQRRAAKRHSGLGRRRGRPSAARREDPPVAVKEKREARRAASSSTRQRRTGTTAGGRERDGTAAAGAEEEDASPEDCARRDGREARSRGQAGTRATTQRAAGRDGGRLRRPRRRPVKLRTAPVSAAGGWRAAGGRAAGSLPPRLRAAFAVPRRILPLPTQPGTRPSPWPSYVWFAVGELQRE